MALFLAGALMVPCFAQASAVDQLNNFFRSVNSFQAEFVQEVLDTDGALIQRSSGQLLLKRPGRFRWDYREPFNQQIISNGKKIWIFDEGLKQVTVRHVDNTLSRTPAMLLAGKGKLTDRFDISPLDVREGMDWVELIPKENAGGFGLVRVGFSRGILTVLEMVDGFNQTTRIVLQRQKTNIPVSRKKFDFVPPEGVDVVGEVN